MGHFDDNLSFDFDSNREDLAVLHEETRRRCLKTASALLKQAQKGDVASASQAVEVLDSYLRLSGQAARCASGPAPADGPHRHGVLWTRREEDHMCRLLRQGLNPNDVGKALNRTRSAIEARVTRIAVLRGLL